MLTNLLVFLAGFLVFQIQPLFAKLLLPDLGGGASIWIVSLCFFQVFLCLGYVISHIGRQKLNCKKHVVFFLLLFFLSLPWVSPIGLFHNISSESPLPLQVFSLLTFSLGLPYLVLASTSPLLQYWFSLNHRNRPSNPYILYGSSNLGSLLGLLTYPFIIEPYFNLEEQRYLWSGCYILYGLLLNIYLVGWWIHGMELPHQLASAPISWQRKCKWIAYAFLPSSGLLAITHYLTQDIAHFPLLWVIPLSLYLVSFIVCFYFPVLSRPNARRSLLCLIPLWSLLLFAMSPYYFKVSLPLYYPVALGCLALFALCMHCHGDLERSKPDAPNLTSFYLYLCIGGAGGGMFVSILAPLIFSSTCEFFLVIWAGIALFSLTLCHAWPKLGRSLYYIALVAIFTVNFFMEMTAWHPQILYRGRSFYNTYKVVTTVLPGDSRLSARLLFQGTTIHGGQITNMEQRTQAITYFHEKTPLAQALLKLPLQNIGIVGLGTGVISVYGKAGQHIDYFEIDPLVKYLAEKYFDLLQHTHAPIRIFLGDGRKNLRKQADHHYDLLVLDAFTGDAVPVHLLTLEAVTEYLQKLRPEGLLFFNISNRYIDLWPVLNGIAKQLNLCIANYHAQANPAQLQMASQWVVLSRNDSKLHTLGQSTRQDNSRMVYWRDAYNCIWPILRIR